MADRGSPASARSAPMGTGDDVDPSDVTMDMTPKEQQQLIATLSKVNANVKLQLFYSEKRVEDLTAALGTDEGEVRNFRTVERRNVEQSVKIETMRAELKERDDIIAACSKHIDELETKMRDARARGERDTAARADEAVALATSVAAETAESVLRELEHAQLDNAALMTRAASAEAALAALRDATAALEADVAAHRSQSAANLRRSILAVASTQAAEQEIERLRSRLNAATAAADEAAADKEVAVAREAAVRRSSPRARAHRRAGSLEEKVNELMAAETSRREEHARVLAEVRADVERARAEADAHRRSAETATTQRGRCGAAASDARPAATSSGRAAPPAERAVSDERPALILIEEARERAHRAEHATTSGADEAVTRARQDAADARAKAEEIKWCGGSSSWTWRCQTARRARRRGGAARVRGAGRAHRARGRARRSGRVPRECRFRRAQPEGGAGGRAVGAGGGGDGARRGARQVGGGARRRDAVADRRAEPRVRRLGRGADGAARMATARARRRRRGRRR